MTSSSSDGLKHLLTVVREFLLGVSTSLDSSLSLVPVNPLHARYLIAHKLASGGFGEVYAGVRKKDGMPVALKLVPKKRMREINTVRLPATLSNA